MSACSSVCLSVCLYQHGSHWTDFRDIRYSGLERKSAEKLQILLHLDKNIGYFTWGPQYVYTVDSFTKLLYLDKCAKRTHGCSLWQNWTLILFTAICRSTTIQKESTVEFPWQQWLHERNTMLRYTFTVYFLWNKVNTWDLRFSWRYQDYGILQGNKEQVDEKWTLDYNYNSTSIRPKGLMWQCKPKIVLRRCYF
jgi:hypothetical protein